MQEEIVRSGKKNNYLRGNLMMFFKLELGNRDIKGFMWVFIASLMLTFAASSTDKIIDSMKFMLVIITIIIFIIDVFLIKTYKYYMEDDEKYFYLFNISLYCFFTSTFLGLGLAFITPLVSTSALNNKSVLPYGLFILIYTIIIFMMLWFTKNKRGFKGEHDEHGQEFKNMSKTTTIGIVVTIVIALFFVRNIFTEEIYIAFLGLILYTFFLQYFYFFFFLIITLIFNKDAINKELYIKRSKNNNYPSDAPS